MSKPIADLDLLNDDELWRAAQNRLSDDTKSQLEALNFKQQRKELTAAEKETLEQLVHQLITPFCCAQKQHGA